MSVTYANGSDLKTKTTEPMTTSLKETAKDAVEVAKRRPVPLVTAAAATVVTAAVAVVAIVLRRRAKPTPKQRAVNAWRSTTKSVRKRVKR